MTGYNAQIDNIDDRIHYSIQMETDNINCFRAVQAVISAFIDNENKERDNERD